jgi:hypothetical protein
MTFEKIRINIKKMTKQLLSIFALKNARGIDPLFFPREDNYL